MPRLYGAPAYTRPPQHHESERPFDPDDLPLEVHRTEAEHDLLARMAGPSEDEAASHPNEQPSFLRRSLPPFSFGGRRP
jgi:hypothetical protein